MERTMKIKAISHLLIAISIFVSACAEQVERPVVVATPTDEIIVQETPQLLTYRGATGYSATLEYEVDYDPIHWQLIEVPENTPQTPYETQRLQNLKNIDCMIDLFGGPIGVEITEQIELAGREWKLAEFLAQIDQSVQLKVPIIMYITHATDPVAGEISYFLTILLPTQDDPLAKQQCQQQAEEVIATFRIVDSVRTN